MLQSSVYKTVSQVDLEVSKLRPKVVYQERERLYDDVMKQRIATNSLQQENLRLKTRLQIVEVELQKRDKYINDIMAHQDQNFGLPVKYQQNQAARISGGLKTETHLILNLKRKIKEVQQENLKKAQEIEALKRNIKSSRMQEIEVEIKLYMEECTRLRSQLEEVIKSKDTFADPQELKIIEEKFSQRDALIQQMQKDNHDLSAGLQKKDLEVSQLQQLVEEMDKFMKKAQAAQKNNQKQKRDIKEKDRTAHKMRKEIIELKS